MSYPKSDYIWMNGEFKKWDECQIHVMSHVVHYGSSVFEGIRCYEGQKNSVIFRLKEHMQRLFDSAKIYRMNIPFNLNELCDATVELIRKNKLKDCYIRPIVFRGLGAFGLLPHKCTVNVAIACWPWGAYLGEEALASGIDVKISTWNRYAPNTMPYLAKAGGNYLNSQLIKMEAVQEGYAEGIALGVDGYVSEGSGENLFLVKEGKLVTPSTDCAILPGITRHAIITLAREMGYTVKTGKIAREALYLADELFFTGTAAEITPIRSVDRITVGSGKRGEITERLQKQFFNTLHQHVPDTHDWLTDVY